MQSITILVCVVHDFLYLIMYSPASDSFCVILFCFCFYFCVFIFLFVRVQTKSNLIMLLLILKLCIEKKKQTKRQHKKIVHETMNSGSPNLTKLKKKSKNTTKYHNIFTIPLFLGSDMIFYYCILEKCYTHSIFTTKSK